MRVNFSRTVIDGTVAVLSGVVLVVFGGALVLVAADGHDSQGVVAAGVAGELSDDNGWQ